jgi:DHA1 family tetracycline resistance protein-like MFS transporter
MAGGSCWGVPLMCLGTLSGPAIMGLMSRVIGPSEQGYLQGANTSLASVSGLFGPGLFTLTFSTLLTRHPGAAFDLAGAILLGALAVAWLATRTPRADAPAR